MTTSTDSASPRQVDYPVDPLFPARWSPRAMSGEPIAPATLMSLFEAARWAPSCFNEQPWRFVYAMRETDQWPQFFDLLVDGNKSWAVRAAALIVVLSRTTFARNGNPSATHSYDTGAAWQSLALQGSRMGLAVHGMAGFDHNRARDKLKVPDGYQVEAMVAVGKPGRLEDLTDSERERESPSARASVAEFAFEGSFPEETAP